MGGSSPLLFASYNNTIHSTADYAPTYLMFGRHGRLPIDLLLGTGQSDGARSTSEWVRQHHQWLHSDYQWVTKHLAVTAAKTKCLYNRTARDCPLLPGERVLV